MALLEFVGTTAFVAVVSLSLIAVSDILVPRRVKVAWKARAAE